MPAHIYTFRAFALRTLRMPHGVCSVNDSHAPVHAAATMSTVSAGNQPHAVCKCREEVVSSQST